MSRKKQPESRRSYSQEFKDEAVQMLLDGHSAVSVVERLGLTNANLLYRWKRNQLRNSGSVAYRSQKSGVVNDFINRLCPSFGDVTLDTLQNTG